MDVLSHPEAEAGMLMKPPLPRRSVPSACYQLVPRGNANTRRGVLLEYIMPLASLHEGVASVPESNDSLIYSPEALNLTSCQFIIQSILHCQIRTVALHDRDWPKPYPNDVQFSLSRITPPLISVNLLQSR